jgi:flagellar basal body-associated protein FliL
MADEPEIEDGESEGGGKSKGLLFAIIAVILLALCVGGYFLLSGGESEETTAAALETTAEDTTTNDVRLLDEFKINLNGTVGARLLVMQIAIEGNTSAVDNIELRQHQIRDAILMLTSDYTVMELEGLDGKLRLRDEIHRRINAVLAPHKIDRVYYTRFEFAS